MPIPKSVLSYLDQNKIKYDTVEHRTVYTAWDSAQTQHIKPDQVVKTLVLKYDAGHCLALLQANKNIDFAKFKKVLNAWLKQEEQKAAKKVSLDKEAWMKKSIVGKVGATPPFGSLLKMPVFIDAPVLKQKKIQVNSGDYDFSLQITASALIKLENPIKGNFGKKK
ncbi:MAG: YbaK/EbsC family protein [Patescibacteria group bacterium]